MKFMNIVFRLIFIFAISSSLVFAQEATSYVTLSQTFHDDTLSMPLISPEQLLINNEPSKWIELGRGFTNQDDTATMVLGKEEREIIYLEFYRSQRGNAKLKSFPSFNFLKVENYFQSRLVIFGVVASELNVQIKPGDLRGTGTLVNVNSDLTAQQLSNCRIAFNTFADTDADGVFDTAVDKLICYESLDFVDFKGSYHQFIRKKLEQ